MSVSRAQCCGRFGWAFPSTAGASPDRTFITTEQRCANRCCSFLAHSKRDSGLFCCGHCWCRYLGAQRGEDVHVHAAHCEQRCVQNFGVGCAEDGVLPALDVPALGSISVGTERGLHDHEPGLHLNQESCVVQPTSKPQSGAGIVHLRGIAHSKGANASGKQRRSEDSPLLGHGLDHVVAWDDDKQ